MHRFQQTITLALLATVAFLTSPGLVRADPLPSWNDTASKQAILAFVEKVTTQGSPDYVAPAERIATFDNDGTPVLVKTPEFVLNDDKEGKPVGIQRHIGRRPIAAFGNSDGDFQMLEWTTSGSGARLGVIIHHTDAEREVAYDRASHIGRLDRGLDEAPKRGWIVVNMRNDWRTLFPTAHPR